MPNNKISRRIAISGIATAAAAVAAVPFIREARSTSLDYKFIGPASDRELELMPPSNCTPGTLSQTEGPYYTPRTPRRDNLIEDGTGGETLVLEGLILTSGCVPVAGAVIDIWHCDENGYYDNEGYRYRGHQFTDSSGAYRFITIRPKRYFRRTPHIHVKVKGKETRLLTSQLYFPDQASINRSDGIFRESLNMALSRVGEIWYGRYDFFIAAA